MQINFSEKKYFKFAFWLVFVSSSLFLIAVVFDFLPMGIPGQWLFPHIEKHKYSFPFLEICSGIFIAVLILLILLWPFSENGKTAKLAKTRLGMAIFLSIFFDLAVIFAGRIGFSENIYAIYDRYACGYLECAYEIESFSDYMSKFHIRQEKQRFINHKDVHPPGRIILSYAVKETLDLFPSLQKIILRTMPSDAENAFLTIKEYDLFPFFKMDDNAVSSGLFLLYFFLGMLAVGKLFLALILWKLYGAEPALLSGAFFIFAPSPILFFGHYDCIMTAQSAILIFLAVIAVRNDSRNFAFIAGLYACFSSLFSVSFGVPCLWTLIYWFFSTKKTRTLKRYIYNYLVPFSAGFLMLVIFLQVIFDFPFFSVLLSCLKNNEQFFMHQSTRTWIWKFLNYIEFFIAAGFPLMILLFTYLVLKYRDIWKNVLTENNSVFCPALISSVCIMFFMFFTPTRAEVSRQWSPVFPLFYLLFPQIFESFKSHRKIMLLLCGIFLVLQIMIFRFYLKIVIID